MERDWTMRVRRAPALLSPQPPAGRRMPARVSSFPSLHGVATTVIAAAILIGACSDPLRDDSEAAAARAHLEAVLDVMEANSVNRNAIDWLTFRGTVRAEAPDPNHLGDTFQAIWVALGLLGDGQSSYTAPRRWNTTITRPAVTCSGDALQPFSSQPDIGYVRVTNTLDGLGAQSYARNLQTSIRVLDNGVRTGWIVDLRGNRSGDIWPLLVGLAPFLGEGTLGYFIDPDGGEQRWEYLAGAALLDGRVQLGISSPYLLGNPGAPVAVLTDGALSGWGEGVALALRARPNTRFFGKASCGLGAATSKFGIEEATLTLAVARMADRNHVTHGGPLVPDEAATTHEQLFAAALAWLRGG